MALSCYNRLPKGSVRLLRLLPPAAGDPSHVECKISTFPLLESGTAHHYEAVSYVWGSPDDRQTAPSILVNGHDMKVTSNLLAALFHLRDDFVERILWIDALCINQKDDVEKGQQVQSMVKIYAQASRVIVWLGEAAVNSGKAFEQLLDAANIHYRQQQQQQKEEEEEEKEKVLDVGEQQEYLEVLALLERPWFQRIWVGTSARV